MKWIIIAILVLMATVVIAKVDLSIKLGLEGGGGDGSTATSIWNPANAYITNPAGINIDLN